MLNWIAENAATLAVSGGLLAVTAAVTAHLLKNKMRGRTACGCGCSGCPGRAGCSRDGHDAKTA